jgi:hypothetical protein
LPSRDQDRPAPRVEVVLGESERILNEIADPDGDMNLALEVDDPAGAYATYNALTRRMLPRVTTRQRPTRNA